MTIFVVENLETSEKRPLFTILGTGYYVTPNAWLYLPLMLGLGTVLSFIFSPPARMLSKLLTGLGYSLLIMLTEIVHTLGHIISSRLVGGPMTAIIGTATITVTHYDDDPDYNPPSRVHVGRSLGGPLFNLLLGAIALALYAFTLPSHFIRFLGLINLILGGGSLLPMPTVDGAVILRELRHWRN